VGETQLEVHPLTADRWDDLVTLFDRPGDPKGCWCMFYRVRSKDFERLWGAGAKAVFREVVADGVPVGWVAVAPRDVYPRILNSPTIRPLDDQPAWAVVCFYVLRGERRGGVAAALLDAAVDFAAEHGATAVEGYPKDTDGARKHANEMFVGSMSMFAEAGFTEAGRRSPTRPIMRRAVGQRRPRRARR
jgi:GNAT superfamily N-acetyltransferase